MDTVVRLVVLASSGDNQSLLAGTSVLSAFLCPPCRPEAFKVRASVPMKKVVLEARASWACRAGLRVSQMFRAWEALEAAANEKRQELEAKDWHSEQ